MPNAPATSKGFLNSPSEILSEWHYIAVVATGLFRRKLEVVRDYERIRVIDYIEPDDSQMKQENPLHVHRCC
jgi:hypothetical protein